jgi:hypothetical protein
MAKENKQMRTFRLIFIAEEGEDINKFKEVVANDKDIIVSGCKVYVENLNTGEIKEL